MKTIRVGDKIPDFSFRDLEGNTFEINKFHGKKQIVIIFFPSDGTNGCKNVVCKFHDITEYFDEENFRIFGICSLPAEILKNSNQIHDLKFPVICDCDNRIKNLFGVSSLRMGKYSTLFAKTSGFSTGRMTFVTSREGEVIYKTESQDGLKCQADEALKINFLLRKTNGIRIVVSGSDLT